MVKKSNPPRPLPIHINAASILILSPSPPIESYGLALKTKETPTCTRTCIKAQCGIFAIGAETAGFPEGCRRSENETESYGLDNETGATSNGSTEERVRTQQQQQQQQEGACPYVLRIGERDEVRPAYLRDWTSRGAEIQKRECRELVKSEYGTRGEPARSARAERRWVRMARHPAQAAEKGPMRSAEGPSGPR
ncbi:hypothetical protein N7474_010158 [Penicillium riverlandense]|uniref:uncharacterized protein n=1 Tax=Penicillium riverlandense TaxID=1903569 RepID=UPI00254663B4|nr:uncharacterized protein N7474_010158 [Penicillium riverlandense]KAJ5808889.1 hypothetical protein N7474_010158 [Penicillium riverlandense]